MTIEEINILQDIVDIYEKEDMYPLLKDRQIRTIKLAIKELKQEPSKSCTDCKFWLLDKDDENRRCHYCVDMDEWVSKTNADEPNRDMEEIEEIMKSDADAETKYKMISNILTAKPHYFAEQEPKVTTTSTDEPMVIQYPQVDGITPTVVKAEQEPCEKCLYAEETDGSHCYECVKGENKFEPQESEK